MSSSISTPVPASEQKSRGGTPRWSKRPTIAEVPNDEHGFNLVARLIRGEDDGQDYEDFDIWNSNTVALG
jgi:hypothetical protein